MFDTAIDLALAAYCAAPTASDDELVARLERQGIERWLALQLVRWIPIAFARPILEHARVELLPTYAVGDRDYPLLDEPVYLAALARHGSASNQERAVTSRRSAEFITINNALHEAGPDASPAGARVALAFDAKLPLGAGDGGAPSVRHRFAAIVEAHGITVTDGTDTSLFAREHPRQWYERGLHARTPSVGELQFDAWVFAQQGPPLSVQADFTVWDPRLAAPQWTESFVGVGASWRAAIHAACEAFRMGSAHVMIAALLDRDAGAGQLRWEPLDATSARFELCVANPLSVFSRTRAPDFAALSRVLKSALAREPLARAVHWIRVCVGGSRGAIDYVEVLLDQAPWPAGAECASRADWDRAESRWEWRWTLALVPR